MTHRRVGLLRLALISGLLVAGWHPDTAAQAPAGTITGQVSDSEGAAISGVSVSLRRDDVPDQPRQFATTRADGTYAFTALPSGRYSLEIRTPRFARFLREGVAVRPGERVRVDARLREPGATASPAPAPQPPPPPPPPPAPAQVGLPGPEPTPPPARGGAARPSPPPSSAGEAVIPVFYATDRNREPGPALDYGSGRSPAGRLALGRFDVSIPRDHQLGNIERPTIWTLFREDPALHFVITRRTMLDYQGFYDEIRSVVSRSGRKDAFVFVHGFNVAFLDAVMRTAQIAYDLGFDGAPILYSWPSDTGASPLGYTAALNNNDWTAVHLDWFLRDVAAQTGAQRIHLIAHSMGNRALVQALNRQPSGSSRLYNQVVLTAPDIDAETFVQLAAGVTRHAVRTTLYASASDVALTLSKQLQEYRRAGDTRPSVLVIPGIDSIDVTAVDSNLIGHFYYGDNRSVISDLFLLLTQGLGPSSRPALRAVGSPPRSWRFVR